MSLTVLSIATDVSLDIRQVLLPSTSADLSILTGWIDRVHKDALHSSVYSYLNITTTDFSTVIDQRNYTIPVVTPARRILGMYDEDRDRLLFPLERASSPVDQTEKQETSPGQFGAGGLKYDSPASPQSLQSAQPEYFRHLPNTTQTDFSSVTFSLYPTPSQVISVSVSTENQVVTLVNPTDTLILPEDSRDMVVAGVNFYANLFLKRAEEAQMWMMIYERLRRGETLV